MYIFGVDIGGTAIKIGLFQEDLQLLDKWSIPTQTTTDIFQSISKNILFYCEQKNILKKDILGYGVGVPGIVKDGIAINCVNLKQRNVDVAKKLKKWVGLDTKIYVANDAKLAALGEYIVTKKKYDSIVFMTLGTGIGGGIIIHQQIQEGTTGLCGEIGHIQADDQRRFQCACGRTGCLETVSSASGMVQLAKYYGQAESALLSTVAPLTAKDIVDAAKQGDALAEKVLDESCMYIAKTLATLALAINPDAFIIGGGVSNSGELLLKKIQDFYLEECLEEAKGTDIILSKLRNDAGIYGAAAYIIQKEKGVNSNGKY